MTDQEQKELLDLAQRHLTKVRAFVSATNPFFGSLILKAKMTIADNYRGMPVDTACTDGIDFIFNPTFLTTLNRDERIFLMCHEVMHKALLHHTRRGKKDPNLWNQGADYAINLILTDAQAGKMPAKGLLDEKYRGMSAEQIYHKLLEEQPPEPEAGWNFGGVLDLPSAGDNPQQEIAQAELDAKTDLNEAHQVSKMAGKEPLGISRVIEDICEPIINWQAELQDFFQNLVNSDYTFSVPNTRYTGGIVMPSLSAGEALGSIAFAVDTSCSVSEDELKQFSSEIISVFDDLEPETLHAIWCDTQVKEPQIFERGDVVMPSDLVPKGGGGTRFAPVFHYVRDEMKNEEVVALVYLTDGYCSDFPDYIPPYPVLWALTERNKRFSPPFGRVIQCYLSQE